jgi:hypothetical protein
LREVPQHTGARAPALAHINELSKRHVNLIDEHTNARAIFLLIPVST